MTLIEQLKAASAEMSSDETTKLLDGLKEMVIRYPDNTELKDAVDEFEASLD